MRVRSFRARTAGERDGDGAATVTTPSGIVIVGGRQRFAGHPSAEPIDACAERLGGREGTDVRALCVLRRRRLR